MASTPDGEQVATQQDYEEAVHETRWIELEDGPGAFEVVEIPPLRLLREMENYGVMALMQGDDGDVDMAEVLNDGDLNGFIEDVVVPNVKQPDVYWADETNGDFDMAALSAGDLMAVITGLTGQDPDELEEQMDDRFR